MAVPAQYETSMVVVASDAIDDALLAEPVRLLQAGEVVVIPTETVYGLAANALNARACERIFQAKNRPSDNPLIVHISEMSQLAALVDATAVARIPSLAAVLARFWPGPLTVLLPKSAAVPAIVTAGHSSVAVRMPSHPIARRIITLAGCPLAAPSANRSGRPSPTTALHAWVDLRGRVASIVDGGAAAVGVESTVVDLSALPPVVLRPGGVTLEQLREVVPDMELFNAAKHGGVDVDKPATPGLKYKHYAPDARVVLVEAAPEGEMGPEVVAQLDAALAASAPDGLVGLIRTQPANTLPVAHLRSARVAIVPLGNGSEPDVVARGIFGAMRELDERGCKTIVIEGVSEAHEGLAVMNRVRKAASQVSAPLPEA